MALPAKQAVPLPAAVPFEVGACLGIPLLTAWRAVHWRPYLAGETMLVAGGAGSVGHYTVQLAKRAGYRVIAECQLCREGGDRPPPFSDIVDYRTQDLGEAVRRFTGGAALDRVVEVNLSANAGHYTEYLRPEGLVVVDGQR